MRLHLAPVRLAALLLVAGTTVAVPAAADAAPVLWTGEVRNGAGAPLDAEVIAYLRPPVDELRVGLNLAPLTRTTTDEAGRFTLRAVPTEAILAIADPWVTVMVVAYSAEGMSVAVDSVAWRPDGWVTRPADLQPGAAPAPALPEEERPSVLVVQQPRPDASVGVAKPPPAGLCGIIKEKDLEPAYVAIGELHLGSHWQGEFTYTNTKSTSFEIGWRPEGKNWSVAGSTSKSRKTEGSSGGVLRAVDHPRMFTYRIRTKFRQYTWNCRGHDVEHTDSTGKVDTVEPTGWTGGVVRDEFGSTPGCPNMEWSDPVPGEDGWFSRGSGSSTTFGRAINVIGFEGAVTSTVSDVVLYKWTNTLSFHRLLCGESNYIAENARVSSLE